MNIKQVEINLKEIGLDTKLSCGERAAAINTLHFVRGLEQPRFAYLHDLINAFEAVEGEI